MQPKREPKKASHCDLCRIYITSKPLTSSDNDISKGRCEILVPNLSKGLFSRTVSLN